MSYNANQGSNGCAAISFNTDLTGHVPVNGGTCWLKTSAATLKMNAAWANATAAGKLIS